MNKLKTLLLAFAIAVLLNVVSRHAHVWLLKVSRPYGGIPFSVLVTKIPVRYEGSTEGFDHFMAGWTFWRSYFKQPQLATRLPHRFPLGEGSYRVDYNMARSTW